MINVNVKNISHISYPTQGIYQGKSMKAYDPYLGEDRAWNGGGRERTPNGFIKNFKIYDTYCNIVPCVGDPHIYLGTRNGYSVMRDYPQLGVGMGGNDNPIIAGGLVIGGNILYDRIKFYTYASGAFVENILSVRAESGGFATYINGEFVLRCSGESYHRSRGSVSMSDMGIDLDFGVKMGFYNRESTDMNDGSRFAIRWFANTSYTWTGRNNRVSTPKTFYYASEDSVYPYGHVVTEIGFFVRRYFEQNMLWGEGNDAGYYITPIAFRSIDRTDYYFRNSSVNGMGDLRYPVYDMNSPFLSNNEYQAAKCTLGLSRSD